MMMMPFNHHSIIKGIIIMLLNVCPVYSGCWGFAEATIFFPKNKDAESAELM
jgi:hypothetical protein